MTLGEQIKQAREEKNLSQEALAEHMGVSRQAVSKWENDTATPQGVNREILAQVLDLEIIREDTKVPGRNVILWSGWIMAVVLLAALIGIVVLFRINRKDSDGKLQQYAFEAGTDEGTEPDGKTETVPAAGSEEENLPTNEPALQSIRFYDSSQNEVTDEALWYNAAKIESILIQWSGSSPVSIKMLATPSGSETMEDTELLLTKVVLDGDAAALLSAEALTDISMSHVYFELDYGYVILTSEIYNVFYDESIVE
ncbi:MAG: helix-turn-helix domain-containing protein [Lachnospiraceae bacterium]|nr:helix-turn-helix domain-containing protein [Lachnospiraceae bacterium]